MKLSNFLEGIEILKFYYKDPNGYHLNAEHDEITLSATDYTLPADEVAKLHALGWHQSGCDSEQHEYSVDENWSAFT